MKLFSGVRALRGNFFSLNYGIKSSRMFQLGHNITLGSADILEKITPADLFRLIREGTAEIRERTAQLRRVLAIDPKKYQELKKYLPYFTCSIFNPPARKKDNFAYAGYFVLDIDHLASKEIDLASLRARIWEDERVCMIFSSPSQDGLKVMFEFEQNMTDPAKYSLFYRLFARQFSTEYALDQVIDMKTCDVSRACFICHDPEAQFRDAPYPVSPGTYIDFDSSVQVREAELALAENLTTSEPQPEIENIGDENLSREILDAIRKKLNPKAVQKKEKLIIVPEELNELERQIRQKAAEVGMNVLEVKDIQYGKQVTFGAGIMKGELNIFYGKRGYSVVRSCRTYCSEELNDLAYQLVNGLLH